MSKKQKNIFIITFITACVIILLAFFWFNRNGSSVPVEEIPWYQQFNPFGSSENIIIDTGETGIDIGEEKDGESKVLSRFFRVTDFAVSGVTFTEERILIEDSATPKEVRVLINPNTKEGVGKIQSILNKTLSLNKPLVESKVIDKPTVEAIKLFQKEKGIPVTGKIDGETSSYFVELKTETGEAQYEMLPAIRYTERKNGHLYKMLLKDRDSIKISNSTIPTIYEAYFNKSGDTTIYRYLSNEDVVNTFLATLGKPSGQYLPANITDISVSKDQNKFFYLAKSNNSTMGIIQNFETNAKQTIFNHPFTEWLSDWDNKGNIYLTTKPSSEVKGSIYILNQSNKTLRKILGGINGLTTKISPDGKKLLYSITDDKGPHLFSMTIDDRKFTNLDKYGLADKCIWSSDSINVYCAVPSKINTNRHPDVWYQGLESFDDYFVKINTTTGSITTIANSTTEAPVDGYNFVLTKDENYLFFINKKDYTLWGLDIR